MESSQSNSLVQSSNSIRSNSMDKNLLEETTYDKPVVLRNKEGMKEELAVSDHLRTPTNYGNINIEKFISEESKTSHSESDLALPCKKNSLKFYRKLCKLMIKHLSNDEDFTNRAFILFFSFVNSFITFFKGRVLDDERIRKIQKTIMLQIWKRQREKVSYVNNHKVCLVTPEEWGSVFIQEEFNKQLRLSSNDFKDVLFLIYWNSIESEQAFTLLYSKIFFILNILLVSAVTYLEMVREPKFMQKMSNFDDFVLMMFQPWLYRFYNHTRGKFAIECCGKCKICKSYALPINFLERLNWSRYYFEQIKTYYESFKSCNLNNLTKDKLTLMFAYWTTNLCN